MSRGASGRCRMMYTGFAGKVGRERGSGGGEGKCGRERGGVWRCGLEGNIVRK